MYTHIRLCTHIHINTEVSLNRFLHYPGFPSTPPKPADNKLLDIEEHAELIHTLSVEFSCQTHGKHLNIESSKTGALIASFSVHMYIYIYIYVCMCMYQ